MEHKFTPGPWEADTADMFGDHNIVLADNTDDARAIAAVVSNLRPEGEVAANARLIATAPELLIALCQYRDDLRYPPAPDSIERRLAMIEKLITRATGEATPGGEG